MKVSSGQEAWTATQVRALIVTGLASSHLQPFIRLLYNDPKTQGRRGNGVGRSRTILVESRDAGDEVTCRRQRERNGKYTAIWTSSTELGRVGRSGEVFNVHPVVNWVELQLWNRFDNGFDVFLGKASVSLHQLQQQCSQAMTNENKVRDSLSTGALWFPLQTSEANGLASSLSVEIECVFTSDSKFLRIHEDNQQRRKRKTKKKTGKKPRDAAVEQQEAAEDDEDDTKSIVDPAFTFTQPFFPMDWALIASTSVRHLFFHSDVERLANFRELVLYSDLERELDEDEALQIHDDHFTAFKACQFSAQYLDHCVETLSQRLQGYSDDCRGLSDTRAQLARTNKSLKAQRKRLQTEHDDLELLISTYQRVLENNSGMKVSDDQLKRSTSPIRNDSGSLPIQRSAPGAPLTSPTASISSKKPAFLMRWEERKHERRLEKEGSKAQRIEDEKQRIVRHVLERQRRDDYAAFISKCVENRKQRAARQLQTFFRSVTSVLHARRRAAERRAATLVQAAWKRFADLKAYPHRLDARKQEVEMQLMAQSEQELRLWLADMEQTPQEKSTIRAMSPPQSIQSNEGEDVTIREVLLPSTSPSKQVVDALVTTWRKLHRMFVIAHNTKDIDYHALFDEIDLRKDDVIDRAELRLGARSFGVRIDRKLTRALITLIRTKCGIPSKPLLLTFEQFMTGFELIPQIMESVDTNPVPVTMHEGSAEATGTASKNNDTINEPAVNHTLNTHEDESIDEEALVMDLRAFRAEIYEAATSFLTALGKPTTDYRTFRDALTHIFSEFDADRNGQLDMDELIACMTSFNLRLSNGKVSLLRKLFAGDRESDKVGVAEFISFVLAHSSFFHEDELGLLGHQIREAIMHRVREAQAETESIEDAVRLVFGAAYKRKDQHNCSIPDFMHALTRLRLGVTSVQLARLVVRLDLDGNRSISFDELLVWLRIRSKSPPGDEMLTSSRRTTAVQLAVGKAKALRVLLEKLSCSLASPTASVSKKTNLTALFRQIDRDNSGKINQEELEVFLHSRDLLSVVGEEVLSQLCGLSTFPHSLAAVVAQEMMALLDLNANGVATLEEWLTFVQHDTNKNPVVIEAMRKTLRESENNDPERLVLWFSELPGTIQAASIHQGQAAQLKVRVAEFKTSLRAKLGGARSVSLQTIDRVVESLDKDSSGWITTSELCAWAFPPRDLEELLRLIIKCWQNQHQESSNTEFAASLYTRFDVDGNGSLAVRELLQGFAPFGLTLSEYEARVLLVAFDVDGDGCWSKSEFLAFVNKLLPIESLVHDPNPTPITSSQHTIEKTSGSPTVQISPRDGVDDSKTLDDSAYSHDDLLFESEPDDLSSLANSDDGETDMQPIQYSDDFVED